MATAKSVGYQFVLDALGLTAFPLERPAAIRPVTRIERGDKVMSVPERKSRGFVNVLVGALKSPAR